MTPIINDRQGNTLPGATQETADYFGQALEAFNLFRGDPVNLIDQAIATAPRCSMAHILKGYLFALATEPAASLAAQGIVEHLRTLPLTEREASHVAALTHITEGEWTAAAIVLDFHGASYPHDLLALQAGHLVDFYRGNARNLRDRVARILPAWSPDIPGYAVLLGMYSFGLEETGDYYRAETTGRLAIEREPCDCWAHHAVTHVMEMQGRAQEGIQWMIERESLWADESNFFKVHNWWHRALFHLDLEQTDEVFALYDGPIRQARSTVVLDLIDASALLWRLELTGHPARTRWNELADAWDQHADARTYPFNDWHAVMAYLGAGRSSDVDRILAACRLKSIASETDAWTRNIALPLMQGFTAFWHGDYPTAANQLHGARYIANAFGGSHAQRDIIDRTLAEATVRGGMTALAQAIANERSALKTHRSNRF